MDLEEDYLNYWEAYVESCGEEFDHPQIEAGIAGSLDIANTLLELYLNGKKSAGSGLVKDYELAGDPLPEPGKFWIVLNSQKKPACILKTVRVETHKFKDIPESIAIAEGEGDLSVEYWQEAHREFFKPFLGDWGIENLEEELVVTEFFELVYF